MNGRLYDARLRRFLSPDNFVQDPWGTQGFNRYGYALNSPLMYVDPDGEFAFIPLLLILGKAAFVGAGVGAVSYTASVAFSDGGFNNWNWGHFGRAVGLGAASGVVSFGIGSAAGAIGGIGGYAVQTAGHAAWGGVNSMLNGGSFWSGALSGAIGNVIGGVTGGMKPLERIAVSAFMGGMGSALSGGDFWQGAAVGGIVAGANHLLHSSSSQNGGEDPNPDRNPNQDRPLTPGEINQLEREGWSHREKSMNGKRGGRNDLWVDKKGNVYEKPKGGSGVMGEWTGYNLRNLTVKVGIGASLMYGTYRLFNNLLRFPMIMNTTIMTLDPSYQYQQGGML